jgi:hypothetical protein
MFNLFFGSKEKKPLRIRVSDPFDFHVEGGDNSVVCDYIDAVRDDHREHWIARARSIVVAVKGQRGSLVVISNRHTGEELVKAWRGKEVSANFSLVPEEAEPCAASEALVKSVPLGIGSVEVETPSSRR